MLTMAPTEEMIAEWKRVFETYHSSLMPNRKSGEEVDQYFREKYPHQIFDNAEFREIVSLNITENDYFSSKLPQNTLPNIQSYKTGNVLVGIDLCTGEFHIESEDIEEVISQKTTSKKHEKIKRYRHRACNSCGGAWLCSSDEPIFKKKDRRIKR